jgi:hypothetical protein
MRMTTAGGLILGLVLGMAQAGFSAEAAGDAVPKEVRDRLETQIGILFSTEMKRAVDPARIAAELAIKMPVPAPALPEAKALAQAEAEIQRQSKALHPDPDPAAIRARMEAAFTAYSIGDHISVAWKPGRMNPATKGRLRAVQADRFQVDSYWILAGDIADEEWLKISPAARAAAVEQELQRELRKARNQRGTCEQEIREPVRLKIMAENGYLPLRAKDRKAIRGWVAAKDVFDQEVARRRALVEKPLREKVEADVYGSAGYVRDGGEWLPKALVEKRREEAAKAAEKKPATAGPETSASDKKGGTPAAPPPAENPAVKKEQEPRTKK